MNNLIQLKECFNKTFNDKNVESMQYKETPMWDSVGHIALISAIEDAFDILFEPEEMMEAHSFKQIMDIMAKNHGVNWQK